MGENTLDIEIIKNAYEQNKDMLKNEKEIVKENDFSRTLFRINSLIEKAANAGQPYVDIDIKEVTLYTMTELAKYYTKLGFDVVVTKGWVDTNDCEMRHNFLKISWVDLREEWS